MDRRDFIRLTGAGIAATGPLSALSDPAASAAVCTANGTTAMFELDIVSGRVEMIDGERLQFLAYRPRRGSGGLRVPGPVLRVREGDTVTVAVTNSRPEAHGFEIGGIAESRMTVLPGQTCVVSFTAPNAGTYVYHDASHASRHLYRLLGLHGAFIVHPLDGASRAASSRPSPTPYSMDKELQTNPAGAQSVSRVFSALGEIARFAGGKWVACPLDRETSSQEKVWLFNQVDPRLNARILASGIAEDATTASAAALAAAFLPRYFTINGRSGFDLADGEDVVARNYIGEPTLIRTMNVGLAHHATHIHGNHVLELAHSCLTDDGFKFTTGGNRESSNGEVVLHESVLERDTWPTAPMQVRDMLLPYEVPPDIPNWSVFADGTSQERFPLRYVMHCHCEMSQTAAGGNYPQGAVTHWEIRGPLGGRSQSPA